MVRIRRIGPDDWQEWRALRLAALSTDPSAFGSTTAQWARADEQRWRDRLTAGPLFLLAEVDGTVCGMVAGQYAEAPDGDGANAEIPGAGGANSASPDDTDPGAGRTAELISLWVAEEYRGHGVATALTSAVEDWAADFTDTLHLEVLPDNHAARHLYERLGYRPFAGSGGDSEGIGVHLCKALTGRRDRARGY